MMKKEIRLGMGILLIVLVFSTVRNAATGEPVRAIEVPAMDVELKDGPGKDLTRAYCGICHSLDYITMQPRFPAEKWKAIVNKMIKVLGAPIGEGDAEIITNYIVKNYGTTPP